MAGTLCCLFCRSWFSRDRWCYSCWCLNKHRLSSLSLTRAANSPQGIHISFSMIMLDPGEYIVSWGTSFPLFPQSFHLITSSILKSWSRTAIVAQLSRSCDSLVCVGVCCKGPCHGEVGVRSTWEALITANMSALTFFFHRWHNQWALVTTVSPCGVWCDTSSWYKSWWHHDDNDPEVSFKRPQP